MLGKSITNASAALFVVMLLASCDKKDEAKTAAAPAASPPATVQPATRRPTLQASGGSAAVVMVTPKHYQPLT